MVSEMFMQEVQIQTSLFEPITLAEMDGVKLMDRMDVKYLIPLALLPDILREAQSFYRVLEIDDNRLCNYKTLYYDTDDLALYKAHQNGLLNRYKVRARNYVESSLSFFEIKYKNNKGRTKKTRISQDGITEVLEENSADFLQKTTRDIIPESLKGILWVNYQRITLVSKVGAERLTIDLNLTFEFEEQQKVYSAIVIAEVKQEKVSQSPFIDLMRKYRLKQGGISKYCFGIISLYQQIKQNKFKKHLRRVSKILAHHDHLTTTNLTTSY
ncbi:polyphosphate polymerase domain-containing protein [Flectobacillus sp. BAB-3569]|uniref:polyphosphate polymerase domain-containing protein n=1 Tax=Flectobacillus sp. BAB-3569 TaxID=1509483 RepID=UPI000BA4AD25|nr:polyphosphate polymerase domain-containing protein [Flectobacillus sp. BAB-3569]PAC31178.1 transporter [Flectobacillus sp. BAB-3569]